METLNLTYGSHNTPEEGMCLMEAVAYLGGEEHSDHPECACPVISHFGRVLNDRMGRGEQGDALRAKYLAPLASKLVGTRSTPEVERRRAFFFADRAVRVFAPLALESAGLKAEAERLRSLPEVVGKKTAQDADAAAWDAGAGADAFASGAGASARAAGTAAARVAADADDADADAAAFAAGVAAASASGDLGWEQAAKVLAEACEIKGGE